MMTIILWILITLLVSSFSAVIGKKYGVEYPIAILAVLVVISNILANKIVMFGPFMVPGGVMVFSMTFMLTDILSEKWGKSYARKAVWTGFYANIILILSLFIVMSWSPAPFAVEISNMFGKVLALTPRIAVAGLLTYLVSQNHDIWAFHFWRKKTKGRHLWFRNNASTIVSQLIDSVLFVTLAFYGVFPILPLIIGQWVVKIIIALLDTPFMYGILWMMDLVEPVRRRSRLRLR
ncbi:queuosine precursor transporter [Candidatus Woesearchaeota archaeon]|nr:queuosine precursor transporter [Candidatus Woesearchaeota archaeon]